MKNTKKYTSLGASLGRSRLCGLDLVVFQSRTEHGAASGRFLHTGTSSDTDIDSGIGIEIGSACKAERCDGAYS